MGFEAQLVGDRAELKMAVLVLTTASHDLGCKCAAQSPAAISSAWESGVNGARAQGGVAGSP